MSVFLLNELWNIDYRLLLPFVAVVIVVVVVVVIIIIIINNNYNNKSTEYSLTNHSRTKLIGLPSKSVPPGAWSTYLEKQRLLADGTRPKSHELS